ncbi:MAG: AAA family ATPase, partial [Hyphomicrobiales bacterium]
MKLTALRLHNIRRFAGRGVAVEGIGDGVNVLCAANEFGKSTCFDALHALFFQPHTGTPGAVQGLRPYSGGNPLVEADILTAGGAFRLTKQFYGGKRAMVRELASGRLLAQADEAERFIANLVQGGTAGPAGLLWVRQGITGIERRSPKDEEGEKRARESVLTSVQGEVESLTGGRRMAQATGGFGAPFDAGGRRAQQQPEDDFVDFEEIESTPKKT